MEKALYLDPMPSEAEVRQYCEGVEGYSLAVSRLSMLRVCLRKEIPGSGFSLYSWSAFFLILGFRISLGFDVEVSRVL